ncbi:unnamed protein product [Owenia fusiformis]|uniref:RUN domain-containing protein n=1 Tax=Owenia fusiformis TaxID=6347 RepID=A0A8S4NZ66_OWEFU|nr:unnamed protein product [Owenia fusiformis]
MMEEVNMSNIGTDESCDNLDYDSFDDQKFEPPAERWAPLGASASPGPSGNEEYNSDPTHTDQLQKLEEEQEQLNSSLLALTTHFAQVQFRLKQIITAPSDDKESLLKELEEFAFKGIPDVRGSHIQDALNLEELSDKEHEKKITEQRKKQQELIAQLKSQLQDLESFAYETGDGELPTSVQMEKHQAMIEQFKNKLDLNIEDFDQKSTEELKQAVDQAIKQIVNPAKVKEKVVEQLKTQIVDLERYLFLTRRCW